MLDPAVQRRRLRITLGLVVAALPWVAVAIPESESVVVILFLLLTFPSSLVVVAGSFQRAPSFDAFLVALFHVGWAFWVVLIACGLLIWLNIHCIAAVLPTLGRRRRRSREPGIHSREPSLPPTDGQYFEPPESQRYGRTS